MIKKFASMWAILFVIILMALFTNIGMNQGKITVFTYLIIVMFAVAGAVLVLESSAKEKELIRLNGYDKGYNEGCAIGHKQGQEKGYFDGLRLAEAENVIVLNQYGMTLLKDKGEFVRVLSEKE